MSSKFSSNSAQNTAESSVVDADSATALQYLRSNGAQLHPALQGSCSNEPQLPFRSELTAIYTEEFKALIEKYQNSSWDPKSIMFAGRTENSWEDVLLRAREAEERYVTAGEGRLRRWSRRMTEQSARALPFVRMIPNDTYWAVISGGVRLVVEAAAKIGEAKQEALKALLRIPYVIVQADECCESFGRDPELMALAEEFYIAGLIAIEGTIKWLNTNVTGKPKKTLMKGPLYNKSFEEKMQNLDEKSEALQARITLLGHKRQQRIEASQSHIESTVKELTSEQKRASAKLDDIQEKQKEQASKTAIEQMIEVLADTNRTAKWMRQKDRDVMMLKAEIKEMRKAANALTKEDILRILAIRQDQSHYDLDKIVRSDLDPVESQLALRITSDDKFKSWQQSDEPSFLFIDTRLPARVNRHVTAVTLTCTYLIKALRGNDDATVIYHFCNQHTDLNDVLAGPAGLMRNLISQFLRCYSYRQFNLDFISRRMKQQLEDLTLRGLCDLFKELIRQLTFPAVLFCIIDNIQVLERGDQAEDTIYLIDVLQGLILDNDEIRPPFLLLMTSPVRTREVAALFGPEHSLTIMSEGASGRRQMTERQQQNTRRRTQTKDCDSGLFVPRNGSALGFHKQEFITRMNADASNDDEEWTM